MGDSHGLFRVESIYKSRGDGFALYLGLMYKDTSSGALHELVVFTLFQCLISH